jgi:hypothetical protein
MKLVKEVIDQRNRELVLDSDLVECAVVMIEVFSVREGVEVVIRIMYLITNHGGLYT